MKTARINLAFLLAVLSCAPSDTFDDPDEFEKFANGAGSPYVQTISKNGVRVSFRYMPAETMMIDSYRAYMKAAAELNRAHSASRDRLSQKLEQIKQRLLAEKNLYAQSLYFHLSIGFEDQSKDLVYDKMRAGREAYSAWLQKLIFEMREFIHLETASGDSIPPDLCHMERSYGLHKSRSFLLMFPSPLQNGRKDQKLTLRIREFGLGTGQLSFQIKTLAMRFADL